MEINIIQHFVKIEENLVLKVFIPKIPERMTRKRNPRTKTKKKNPLEPTVAVAEVVVEVTLTEAAAEVDVVNGVDLINGIDMRSHLLETNPIQIIIQQVTTIDHPMPKPQQHHLLVTHHQRPHPVMLPPPPLQSIRTISRL